MKHGLNRLQPIQYRTHCEFSYPLINWIPSAIVNLYKKFGDLETKVMIGSGLKSGNSCRFLEIHSAYQVFVKMSSRVD